MPFIRLFILALVVTALAGCSMGGDGEDEVTAEPVSREQRTPVITARCADGDGAAVAVPDALTIQEWNLAKPNHAEVRGCVTLDGEPVAGARVTVGAYRVPEPTDAKGRFTYELDVTVPVGRIVKVADASDAQVGGESVSDADRAALESAEADVGVHFALSELAARRLSSGDYEVSGRAAYADGSPPPPVVLFAYRLSGRVRDAQGRPVKGARVSTRTLDQEGWTLSDPSDASGHYTSFFYPSSEGGGDVLFTIRVAKDQQIWEFPESEVVAFKHLRSAIMDVDLPPAGYPVSVPTVKTDVGAVYEGVLIGALDGDRSVRPLRARWADRDGEFSFVLPGSLAGRQIRFWQSQLYAFSEVPVRPGGDVDLAYWPKDVPADAPRELASLTLPG